MEGKVPSIRDVQDAWHYVQHATGGRTVATRATLSLKSENILQADCEPVKKVANVDTIVKALPEGLWFGGRQVLYHAFDLNEALTWTCSIRQAHLDHLSSETKPRAKVNSQERQGPRPVSWPAPRLQRTSRPQ